MSWEYYYWQCCSNIFLEDCPQGSSVFNPHPPLFLPRFLLSFWQPIIFQPLSSFPPSSQLKLNKHFLTYFIGFFSQLKAPHVKRLFEHHREGWCCRMGIGRVAWRILWVLSEGLHTDCSLQALGVLSRGEPAKSCVRTNTSLPVLHQIQSLGWLKGDFGELWSCCFFLQQPAWSAKWIWMNTGHKVASPCFTCSK